MAMVSIKSFVKEIRKTLIYKIAPAQTKLIVSVYKFSNTVTWVCVWEGGGGWELIQKL